MTALQAALLTSHLRRWPEEMRRREQAARRLAERLREIPGIRPCWPTTGVTRHAWHLFPFLYDPRAFGGRSRAEFLRALAAEGVPASPGYPLLSENEALWEAACDNAARAGAPAPRWDPEALPVARDARDRGCWFFHTVLLAGEEGVDDAARAVAKIQAAWGGA